MKDVTSKLTGEVVVFLLIPGSPPAPNLDKSFPLILRIRRYREAWVTKSATSLTIRSMSTATFQLSVRSTNPDAR